MNVGWKRGRGRERVREGGERDRERGRGRERVREGGGRDRERGRGGGERESISSWTTAIVLLLTRISLLAVIPKVFTTNQS